MRQKAGGPTTNPRGGDPPMTMTRLVGAERPGATGCAPGNERGCALLTPAVARNEPIVSKPIASNRQRPVTGSSFPRVKMDCSHYGNDHRPTQAAIAEDELWRFTPNPRPVSPEARERGV